MVPRSLSSQTSGAGGFVQLNLDIDCLFFIFRERNELVLPSSSCSLDVELLHDSPESEPYVWSLGDVWRAMPLQIFHFQPHTLEFNFTGGLFSR